MGGLFDIPVLSGFIVMRLGEDNRYIYCVQSTMKFLEPYCLPCKVMQGRASGIETGTVGGLIPLRGINPWQKCHAVYYIISGQ